MVASLIDGEGLALATFDDGSGLALGPPTGYVVKFTNGLTAYLSGDTGIHTEMKTVVHDYHKANLAVLNLGQSAMTVNSATYALNELVKPTSVIFSHVNEVATEGGKLKPATRAAALDRRASAVRSDQRRRGKRRYRL